LGRLYLEALRPYPCYGGLDLASVADLTSFVLVWPVEGLVYVYPWFWIPGDDIKGRSKRDAVRYDLWAEKGYIETTQGNVTDHIHVTDRICQLSRIFNIRQVGFDRHGATDTVRRLMDDSIDVVEVGQGFLSMSAPSKRLEALVLAGKLRHTGHPVLRWNSDCCTIVSDAAGNIKPVKPDRKKSSKRIDGVVAAVMAIDCAMKHQEIEAGVL
jgi:phage terminase large subunit-like protein